MTKEELGSRAVYIGGGITLREHFAAMAMQALLADRNFDPDMRSVACNAIAAADALCEAMAAKPGQNRTTKAIAAADAMCDAMPWSLTWNPPENG